MPTRALLTGASGFVGRRLLHRLQSRDVHCTVLSRRDPADFPQAVDVVRGDCRDGALVHGAVGRARPDVVFHCAMTSGHPATNAARVEMLETAVLGTANLLHATQEHTGARFVHACSGLIYAPQARPLVEDDPLAPTTTRGVAKAGASLLVRQVGTTTALHTVSLRIFSVYGPGEAPTRFIPTVLRCARDASPLPLIPWPRHDFVHVDDVVDALLVAASADVPSGSAFNISGGRTWSNAEVVSLAEEVSGRPITIATTAHPSGPADQVVWHGDISAARTRLGWVPATELRAGLQSFFELTCRT